MDEHEGIKIIRVYKGKKVTQTFFRNNKHLFTDPAPYLLESAIDLLKRMEQPKKIYPVYIDESGKVSFVDPG